MRPCVVGGLLALSLLALGGQVRGQFEQADLDLEELENTPFMLGDQPYRDMLTIGASQAVASFASRVQTEEEPQSPQFYSHTLSQPVGHPIRTGIDTLDYSSSRRIRVPADIVRDRVLADREEAAILAERDANDIPDQPSVEATTASRGLSERPRTSTLRLENFGNYQTVVGHGQRYSTNTVSPRFPSRRPTPAPAPASPIPSPTPYTPYVPSPTPYSLLRYPSPSPAPYARASGVARHPLAPARPVVSGRPTVDYNYEVAHRGGGSYSYSTFG